MLVRAVVAATNRPTVQRIAGLLDSRDVTSFTASSLDEVWLILKREDIDLVIASEGISGPSPEGWTRAIRDLPEAPDLVILAEQEDPSRRATLLAAGCLAVLNVRLSDRDLRGALRALASRLARDSVARAAAERLMDHHRFEGLVHESPAMAEVVTMARRLAGADSPVLVLGETGVGKELLARSIHFESPRASGPFVPVNCGAIPEGMLESELFGYEAGAFTGAMRAHRGHFEMAHGGTLFLDEIGELPLHLQVKLLRVIEDRRVQRLGSERPEQIDVRIMAATNRPLEEDVEARLFRADLYYRIAVVTLSLPPLRQRREDVRPLVERYLGELRSTLGRPGMGIDAEALSALEAYAWPGNVRELINVLERGVLLAPGPKISLRDLPRSIAMGQGARPEGTRVQPTPLATAEEDLPIREARRVAVEAFERAYLSRLLARTSGRVGETAKLAGISERSLYELMKRNGLRKEEFRTSRP